MKVILLGDTHLGARGGDLDFARYFNTFYRDVLYPYMLENGIDTIIQAGDFFDDQTELSLDAYHVSKPEWLRPLEEHDFHMYVLIGNHDIAYKNTLRVNSPELFLSDGFPNNVTVISEPTILELNSYKFGIVPWICKENYDESIKFIEKQEASALIGHFDIAGFAMQKGGQVSKKGLPKRLFEHYPFVFSGHFHTRSQESNITYLGVPYQLTWSDYGDPKGFHVFDTETQQLEFIENPNQMFVRLNYAEGMKVDETLLEGKIVKLVTTDRGNLKKYNTFIDAFKQINTKDTDIVEHILNTEALDDAKDLSVNWVDDTPAFIRRVIDTVDTDLEKSKLTDYILMLHERASLRC